jgi:hypothetical protein
VPPRRRLPLVVRAFSFLMGPLGFVIELIEIDRLVHEFS